MVEVRFGILGPVRVWGSGAEVDAGPRQQRLILALLLARGNASISRAELIEAVWDGEAPPSAANVVHRAVGSLRRLMEPDLPVRSVGSRLSRSGSGYQLRVEAQTLDLLEFRGLVAQARQSVGARAALDLYLRALRLWRGPRAAELERTAGAHAVFRGIDTERSQAVREATDVALRAHDVAAVLPVLRSSAELNPLDEGLQSRLVLALAADGQREAALAVHDGVAGRLADELGLDPGQELRTAYDLVARVSGADAPAQLPSDHPHFVVRQAVVDRALAVVARSGPSGVALTIDGMPGAGKTTLAIHLGRRLAGSYPDGQLYADLRGFDRDAGVMTPQEALRGFLSSLGVLPRDLPGDLPELVRLYRERIAPLRVLLLLDNCRDATQVRDLMPGTPGSLVIMTSRSSGASPGGDILHLGLPDAAEARALLALRVGAARVDAEPAAADDIVDRCGRLPLALALVAARAAATPEVPLAEIAEELAGARDEGVDFLAGDMELRAAFSWSYRALTPAAARLFRLLPSHPASPMSLASVAALAGTSAGITRMAVGELITHALLESEGDRFEMHSLLRAYASTLGGVHTRSALDQH